MAARVVLGLIVKSSEYAEFDTNQTRGAEVPEIDPDVTKLTVNITPRARLALEAAAEQLGDTHTDTVTRALVVYAEICLAPVGTVITLGDLVVKVEQAMARGLNTAEASA